MSKNKYLIEALLFASYAVFGMCWVGGSVFIPQIMRQMGIHDLAAGSHITTAVAAAKLLGAFIAAAVLARLGAKKAVALAMALMALGALAPFAHNYPLRLSLRFLMGLGGALIIVYFAPIVMLWFDAGERPFVNGLNSVAFHVGAVAVLFGLLVDLRHGDYALAMLFITALSSTFFIGSLLLPESRPDMAAAPARPARQTP